MLSARRTFLICISMAVVGCSNSTVENGAALSSFALVDVNDTSTTAGQQVAPSDFTTGVSAWYFAHAT